MAKQQTSSLTPIFMINFMYPSSFSIREYPISLNCHANNYTLFVVIDFPPDSGRQYWKPPHPLRQRKLHLSYRFSMFSSPFIILGEKKALKISFSNIFPGYIFFRAAKGFLQWEWVSDFRVIRIFTFAKIVLFARGRR